MKFKFLILCSLALCVRMELLFAATVLPSNIHLVVPFPAGGGADSMARALAQAMSVELERNVVVENRSGAGGAIGAEYVARSAPGCRLLFTSRPNNRIGWGIGAFSELTKVGRYEANEYNNHPA